jgi:BED zinc finger
MADEAKRAKYVSTTILSNGRLSNASPQDVSRSEPSNSNAVIDVDALNADTGEAQSRDIVNVDAQLGAVKSQTGSTNKLQQRSVVAAGTSSAKKSHIWDYFAVSTTDERFAICVECKASISRGGKHKRSFTNAGLKDHLHRHHKDLHEMFEAADSTTAVHEGTLSEAMPTA